MHRRLTRADQSDATMTSVTYRGKRCHSAGEAWHAAGEANKQHECSSKHFACTIKCKIVIGIDTKIQSSPWTQTWPNKYRPDCPSSTSWNQMDPGRVKCPIFSLKLCNCGLLKSPFHQRAVLGETEKITQFMTCPVIHCFACRKVMRCTGLDV